MVWIDRMTALCVAILIATPTLRSALGVPAAVYVAATGGIVLAAFLNLTLARIARLRPVLKGYVVLLSIFVTWMLTTTFWTISNVQFPIDIILLLGNLTLILAAPFAFPRRALRYTIDSTSITGVVIATYVFYSYLQVGSFRGYEVAITEFYLTVSKPLGIAAVTTATMLLVDASKRRLRFFATLYIVLGLSLSLARGAFLFSVGITVSVFLYALMSAKNRPRSLAEWLRAKGKKVGGVSLVVGGLAVVVAAALTVERTAQRLARLFSGSELAEGGRGQMWAAAWDNISQSPVTGYGLGSSGVMSGRIEGFYPHNLFLQAWVDGGLVGLLLLIAVVLIPVSYLAHRLFTSEKYGLWLPYGCMLLFLVAEYMKSYSLYTGRALFLSSVLLMITLSLGSLQSD